MAELAPPALIWGAALPWALPCRRPLPSAHPGPLLSAFSFLISQLLALHGLTDSSRKKQELLPKMVGLQLQQPFPCGPGGQERPSGGGGGGGGGQDRLKQQQLVLVKKPGQGAAQSKVGGTLGVLMQVVLHSMPSGALSAPLLFHRNLCLHPKTRLPASTRACRPLVQHQAPCSPPWSP